MIDPKNLSQAPTPTGSSSRAPTSTPSTWRAAVSTPRCTSPPRSPRRHTYVEKPVAVDRRREEGHGDREAGTTASAASPSLPDPPRVAVRASSRSGCTRARSARPFRPDPLLRLGLQRPSSPTSRPSSSGCATGSTTRRSRATRSSSERPRRRRHELAFAAHPLEATGYASRARRTDKGDCCSTSTACSVPRRRARELRVDAVRRLGVGRGDAVLRHQGLRRGALRRAGPHLRRAAVGVPGPRQAAGGRRRHRRDRYLPRRPRRRRREQAEGVRRACAAS